MNEDYELSRLEREAVDEMRKDEYKEQIIDEIIKLTYSEANDSKLGAEVRKRVYRWGKL